LLEKLARGQESGRLRRSKRDAGCKPAQFEHPVPDVTVLGQMRRSTRFAAPGYHLVERATMGKLRVEVPAEFTRPAGAGVEAIDDGWVDVFHEGLAPGRGENGFLARFVRQSHNTRPRLVH